MKIFATLICLLFATTSFAQQRPSKQSIDSLGNIDNMPIHKGHGDAIDMPTRKGQGNAIDIPTLKAQGNAVGIHNRLSAHREHSATLLPKLKGPAEWFLLDSSNRPKPNDVLPYKRN